MLVNGVLCTSPLMRPTIALTALMNFALVGGAVAQSPEASPPPAEAVPSDAVTANQRVHLIIDRKTELGGTVVAQDDLTITIAHDGKQSVFRKDDVLDVIPLLDLAAPAMGVIYRRDGSGFRAEILSDDFDAVRYRIGKVPGSIARADVYRIGISRPFEERYKALLATIQPDDTVRRLALCDWLISERQYELAREQLVKLVDDTKMSSAVALLKQVEAQLNAMKASGTAQPANDPRTPQGENGNGLDRPLPTRILSADEMNIFRVYEIDFDIPPRVVIDQADTKALLEQYSENPLVPRDAAARTAIVQGDPLKVVRLAFELKARDFYPKIRVASEPFTMSEFRRKVHDGWLIPNCATSRCHGGPDAGKFFLFNNNTADARVRSTNLLTLLRGNSGGRPLVNFEDPIQSVIVQYALPADEAATPHPAVKGWRPIIGSKVHPQKLAETLGWIRSMYQPRPTYPIDYQPPDLSIPMPGTPDDADEPTR